MRARRHLWPRGIQSRGNPRFRSKDLPSAAHWSVTRKLKVWINSKNIYFEEISFGRKYVKIEGRYYFISISEDISFWRYFFIKRFLSEDIPFEEISCFWNSWQTTEHEIKSILKLKVDIISSKSRKRFLLEDISLLRYSFRKRFLSFEIHDKHLNIFNIIMDTKSTSEGIYSCLGLHLVRYFGP